MNIAKLSSVLAVAILGMFLFACGGGGGGDGVSTALGARTTVQGNVSSVSRDSLGAVSRDESLEVVPVADVLVDILGRTAVTDSNGDFSINIPADTPVGDLAAILSGPINGQTVFPYTGNAGSTTTIDITELADGSLATDVLSVELGEVPDVGEEEVEEETPPQKEEDGVEEEDGSTSNVSGQLRGSAVYSVTGNITDTNFPLDGVPTTFGPENVTISADGGRATFIDRDGSVITDNATVSNNSISFTTTIEGTTLQVNLTFSDSSLSRFTGTSTSSGQGFTISTQFTGTKVSGDLAIN